MLIRTIKPNEYNKITELITKQSASENEGGEQVRRLAALREEVTYDDDFELVALELDKVIGHGIMTDIAIGKKSGYLLVTDLIVAKSFEAIEIREALLIELIKRAREACYRGVVLFWQGDRPVPSGYRRLNSQTYYLDGQTIKQQLIINECHPTNDIGDQCTVVFPDCLNIANESF